MHEQHCFKLARKILVQTLCVKKAVHCSFLEASLTCGKRVHCALLVASVTCGKRVHCAFLVASLTCGKLARVRPQPRTGFVLCFVTSKGCVSKPLIL